MCPTQVLKLEKDKKKRCANIEKDINDSKTDSFTKLITEGNKEHIKQTEIYSGKFNTIKMKQRKILIQEF